MKLVKTALATTTFALLAGCMVGPDFEKPAAPASTHYDVKAEQALAGNTAQHIDFDKRIDGDWWSSLGSPKLDQVMRKVIEGNLGLEAADATIAQANEAVTSVRGALSPQVDLAAQGGRQRGAGATGFATSNFYAVGPRVSFDLDLFGGTRRRIEEQAALADSQRHRFDAAYLTVTGDVATQALTLASARAQIAAVESLLANDRKNLELVQTAHRYGSATQVDVATATTQLAQDETLLPPLAQQRDTAAHALSVLAGKGPADWVPPDFDLADFALPAQLPVTLPSDLAHDRPDILEAESQLHAASAAIGVATSDLYPHLSLSGSLTRVGPAPGLGTLWGLAAGLTAPIFNGGTLKANQRGAVDGYKAALATYQQTVVSSLGQVADVLQAINHDSEEVAAQDRALTSAALSLALNREGYKAGETGVLQVIDAERSYQRALIGQIQAKTAQFQDTVQLSVALGGHSDEAFQRRAAYRDERSMAGGPTNGGKP
ncbi:RND transporter [Luteibacter rhizovicinus DSM 16549]|uniref:RND transporter n=1 Tax=Luteibacter rhizovicinus DSM 16549 TaxID=1440763 RepID=A0A0G9HGR9_9GAMM|nr:efflux transporter outer membrane subunit [Luteibacter rhizovicinus]APG03702.1 RND transporter [Luteibacter rhizovicinus DSM 16549]KLD68646.1 RND transporter [Luteibacter rhizovicinus DSM 16549]KLD76004.1 RND transporter [Xanthomonas hyacinthi DSM 19077]